MLSVFNSLGNFKVDSVLLLQADIMNDQLTMALEPEAASVYCQHLPDMRGSTIFKPGSKYMVIDLGGTY